MRGLLDWFVENPVAANLLMVFVIVGGLLTMGDLKQEVFPDVAPDYVIVTVVYPGATPEEVEEGICLKVEEVIEGLEGVKRITSTADESLGTVMAELYEDADKGRVLDDIKTHVDAISTFPAQAEKPVIQEAKSPNMVMNVVVSGETDEITLNRLVREVRDELAALPGISRVELAAANRYEISIEISEDALRRYGLTFDEVARAIRQNSLNLYGGTILARDGDIVLRTDAQAYHGPEFERILLLTAPDGTRLTLGDVARVVDGFKDQEQGSRYDGKPAATLTVFRVGDQSAPEVARAVRTYLEKKRRELPEGISLTISKDWSVLLHQRLDLLLRNGRFGLILIFALLVLFLRTRVAFWVAAGIPTAMLGAVWLLPLTGATINMLSLFGFILVLGILVDDGIVVGENIYHHARRGESGPEAARKGVREVFLPVVFSVLTTIAAFIPMLKLPGIMGKFARVIPIVVVCSLTFSLVEALLILPHHLSHMKPPGKGRRPPWILRPWQAFTGFFSHGLEAFVRRIYRPFLLAALRWRYLTFAVGGAVLLLAVALLKGGWIKFTFFPPVEGDQVVVSLTMAEGTSFEETKAAMVRIEAAARAVRGKYDRDPDHPAVKHVLVSVGSQPRAAERNWQKGGGAPRRSNLGEVFLELHPPEIRGAVTATEIMRDLRKRVGEIPGARELTYEVDIHAGEPPISVRLSGARLEDLGAAARRVKEWLAGVDGTYDIADDLLTGKREMRIDVNPHGEALGITRGELARQVRQAFYGEEAERIQRGRDDVKVMVRYPKDRRRTLAAVERMMIRRPGGVEIPFSSVATVTPTTAPSAIHRADGRRAVTVRSDLDLAVANANEIVARMKSELLPELAADYPGLSWTFEGEQRQQAETMGGIRKGSIIAGLLIYTLLALMFGSFLQPVIVSLAIPFGLVGALLGHLLLGMDLTVLSIIGLLAVAGVAVNDSMILIDFANRARKAGSSAWEAICEAGPRRFRPILLTSLTTFAGLAPLIFEKSMQAQFLIPMAISLSFGVMFSTLVILIYVPAIYLILEDVRKAFQ